MATKTTASFDEALVSIVNDRIRDTWSKDRQKEVDSITAKVLEELQHFKPIEVHFEDGKKKEVKGVQHYQFEEVLTYLRSGSPLFLVGEAGSGKTHLVESCAEAMDKNFYSISVNEQTSKVDFLGYMNAEGKIVKTNFRNAYEQGGVFCVDEIDAGNPNILTVLNSALSNETCAFPDGMVKRHKDFICVCTANTFGTGDSMTYIGRNIIDAATLDRFIILEIKYCNKIEKVLFPHSFKYISKLRAHFEKEKRHHIVSTRGGIRLETLWQVKERLSKEDVINCLHLQKVILEDSNVNKVLSPIYNLPYKK